MRNLIAFLGVALFLSQGLKAEILEEHVHVYQEEKLLDLHEKVAATFLELVRRKPTAVIYLPTGSTPKKTYRALIRAFQEDSSIDLSKATFFNLDEYAGLVKNHPLSYARYMDVNFYGPLRAIDPKRAPKASNTFIPTIQAEETVAQAAARYRQMLADAGPADLVILGVGGAYPETDANGSVKLLGGHVAFNEPGTPVDQSVHVVTLTAKTRKDTGFRFKSFRKLYEKGEFPELGEISSDQFEVPTEAISVGLKEIMSAKHVLLLATGENKMPVVKVMFEAGVSSDFPVTHLKNHPHKVELFLDEAAAALTDLKAEGVRSDLADAEIAMALKTQLEANSLPEKGVVLILSPHPDDDVIGMSATIKALQSRGNQVHVVYAVTGENAVRESNPTYLQLAKDLKGQLAGSEEEVILELKTRVREKEATAATAVLRVPAKNLHFLRAEYYNRRGLPGVVPLTQNDLTKMQDLLIELKPDVAFFAAENDPHGAHGLSTKLLAQAASSKRVRAAYGSKKLSFMGYRGAYNEWALTQPDNLVIQPFDAATEQLKEAAIKAHQSQLVPLFPSFDPDPFYLRTQKRNRASFEKLKSLDVISKKSESVAAEVFMQFSEAQFLRRYS